MPNTNNTFRSAAGVGLGWFLSWLTLWGIAGAIIATVDPDSIDPGDGRGAVLILGSMGLLSGIMFGALLTAARRTRPLHGLSFTRATALGLLSCAAAQVPYLGHGDQGIAANSQMALLFTAFGGMVTAVWFAASRIWPRWPLGPSELPHR